MNTKFIQELTSATKMLNDKTETSKSLVHRKEYQEILWKLLCARKNELDRIISSNMSTLARKWKKQIGDQNPSNYIHTKVTECENEQTLIWQMMEIVEPRLGKLRGK